MRAALRSAKITPSRRFTNPSEAILRVLVSSLPRRFRRITVRITTMAKLATPRILGSIFMNWVSQTDRGSAKR